MTTRKLLSLLLCFALLLMLPACDSDAGTVTSEISSAAETSSTGTNIASSYPVYISESSSTHHYVEPWNRPDVTLADVTPSKKTNEPFKNLDDFLQSLVSEDGKSFCFGPTPLYCSKDFMFKSQGITSEDYHDFLSHIPATEQYGQIELNEKIEFTETDLSCKVLLGWLDDHFTAGAYVFESPSPETLSVLCDKVEKWAEPFTCLTPSQMEKIRDAIQNIDDKERGALDCQWKDQNGYTLTFSWSNDEWNTLFYFGVGW